MGALDCTHFRIQSKKINIEKYLTEYNLDELSRFKAVIQILETIPDEKVVIVAAYKQPLQLLTHYLRRQFPSTLILQHYGGANNWPILQEFHEHEESAFLLAVRSSMSEAVSIGCCNHMICID